VVNTRLSVAWTVEFRPRNLDVQAVLQSVELPSIGFVFNLHVMIFSQQHGSTRNVKTYEGAEGLGRPRIWVTLTNSRTKYAG
jgi:hypothetical protein